MLWKIPSHFERSHLFPNDQFHSGQKPYRWHFRIAHSNNGEPSNNFRALSTSCHIKQLSTRHASSIQDITLIIFAHSRKTIIFFETKHWHKVPCDSWSEEQLSSQQNLREKKRSPDYRWDWSEFDEFAAAVYRTSYYGIEWRQTRRMHCNYCGTKACSHSSAVHNIILFWNASDKSNKGTTIVRCGSIVKSDFIYWTLD